MHEQNSSENKGSTRWIRSIGALLIGVLTGGITNIGLISLGNTLIPPPNVDLNSPEGLQQAMLMFGPEDFLFPWLGHAIGTLVGVLVAALVQKSTSIIIPTIITLMFLTGGITMVMQLPSPLWFDVADLVGAYVPMGYLGYILAMKRTSSSRG